jgi:glycerol dehydrogenase-like iron-containing ADH family enzyme
MREWGLVHTSPSLEHMLCRTHALTCCAHTRTHGTQVEAGLQAIAQLHEELKEATLKVCACTTVHIVARPPYARATRNTTCSHAGACGRACGQPAAVGVC